MYAVLNNQIADILSFKYILVIAITVVILTKANKRMIKSRLTEIRYNNSTQ